MGKKLGVMGGWGFNARLAIIFFQDSFVTRIPEKVTIPGFRKLYQKPYSSTILRGGQIDLVFLEEKL